jgi:anti-sigma regulatory factor (Ser/Thr protein kinase)
MSYEEKEMTLAPGDRVLLHSDGIAEAHDPDREMFGFPRLAQTMADVEPGQDLIQHVLTVLEAFIGPDAEQEDDITMVSLERAVGGSVAPTGDDLVLVEFELESVAGNERRAIDQVEAALGGVGLEQTRLDNLKTAVGEATMNAMEHGNEYQADRPVHIRVLRDAESIRVRVTDQGEVVELPDPEAPDLEAKLAGRQKPRGWGMFLIEKLVDETHVTGEGGGHTLELVVRLEGGSDDHA